MFDVNLYDDKVELVNETLIKIYIYIHKIIFI